MSATRRHRPLALQLALAAVLGQLLLPQVYSGLRAERLVDPRLYAFCGVRPAAANRGLATARLVDPRAPAPTPAHDDGDCAWCGVLHAIHHAAPTGLALRLPSQRPSMPGVTSLDRAPTVRLVYLPQLRGPPFSF